jgi:PAS domain S-box-containing protein
MNRPLSIFHSWPLYDMAARMELASLALLAPADLPEAATPESGRSPIGIWSCDLATGALNWTQPIHELFGLPCHAVPTRDFALACYEPESRRAMEGLRGHAIAHRRGFTMDALLHRLDGQSRWMRLSAMPVLGKGKAVRLVGTKQDVTSEYDGTAWLEV